MYKKMQEKHTEYNETKTNQSNSSTINPGKTKYTYNTTKCRARIKDYRDRVKHVKINYLH
jgi:hypothetical protein